MNCAASAEDSTSKGTAAYVWNLIFIRLSMSEGGEKNNRNK